MTMMSHLPRWSIEVVRTVVILAIVLAVGTVYQARGDNHDTTYYACLFAGSLSQVNTNGTPANCGRGAPISWVSGGQPGMSQAYAANDGSSLALDFAHSNFNIVLPENLTTVESVAVPAGSYVVSSTVLLHNNANERIVSCFVMASTSPSIVLRSSISIDPSVALAQYGTLPVVGVVTLDAAGSVEVRCGVFNSDPGMIGEVSDVTMIQVSLTAIPVEQVN